MYPQRVQSPQALTNRRAIRSHTRTRNLRFLGTFLGSIPLLVVRRGDSVEQRTLLVAFERYSCPSASQGASRSRQVGTPILLFRPASDDITAHMGL